LKLVKTSKEQFIAAITEDKGDRFAKTFVAKANMQDQWDMCVGLWEDDELLGAIITTISKRSPKVANLQLLHTFVKHRGKGVGKILCNDTLLSVKDRGAVYLRVSSEPDSVGFYNKIGFKFLGRQKSGCELSIFRIAGDTFAEGDYSIDDSVVYNAVHKKGKGGCVTVFVEPSDLLFTFAD
jgi:ribosomal protein S18 acetylase RimI-like enzyme